MPTPALASTAYIIHQNACLVTLRLSRENHGCRNCKAKAGTGITPFLQRVRVACYACAMCYISHGPGICPSIRLSRTGVHWVKTTRSRLGSRNLQFFFAKDSAVKICTVYPEILKRFARSKTLNAGGQWKNWLFQLTTCHTSVPQKRCDVRPW